MKNIKVFIAILALVLGGVAYVKADVAHKLASSVDSLGGQFEEYDHKWFQRGITVGDEKQMTISQEGDIAARGGLTQGGGIVTVTPVSASVTLTESQLLTGNIITFSASNTQAALTVTLPATSTLRTLMPNAGDYRSWVIENPFTAAATTTTIAAGTGIDLQEPDGQNVVIGINNYAWLTCFRELSTDVVCRVDESIQAD